MGHTGARRINEAEAEIVRRIFAEYAAGRSPRAIALRLNQGGVPGPRGGQWRDTAIRGHITRGTGILNNELYIGRLVWNRQQYRKDPSAGRRRSRLNDAERRVIEQVPDLRIIEDELWAAVKARQKDIRESEGVTKARKTRFWEHRRARHLTDRTGVLRQLRRPPGLGRPRRPGALGRPWPGHVLEPREHPPELPPVAV